MFFIINILIIITSKNRVAIRNNLIMHCKQGRKYFIIKKLISGSNEHVNKWMKNKNVS